ncbi:endonuclease domain-containing protein [Angustibacter luteus]|uniref:Endonuclease domain-containing protein n=1 Tax=Angustibacter luteus TaxID=658456 RepID=A0ABW1JDB6_9ACTN
MPSQSELPTALIGRPFTVAEALALGASRDVLRGNRFRTPFRGVRIPVEFEDTLTTRCLAATLVLPKDSVFSHATAARIHALPVPGHWRDGPLHVSTATHGLRRQGMEIHLASNLLSGVDDDHALPIRAAAQCWAELATQLPVDELVVVGDAALRRGLVTQTELTMLVGSLTGRRGVRRLHRALPLLEPATDSPMETRTRLLLVRAGLPRPVANRDVVVDGVWLARPDLSYPDLKIAIEYEGDHHRTDRRQWLRDKTRRRLLEDAGWIVIEVTSVDVHLTPAVTVARVSAAIASRSK